MEIITKEELQGRLHVDHRMVEVWIQLGMPHLRLPGRTAQPGKRLNKSGPVRFVFEKTVAWLESVTEAGTLPMGKNKEKGDGLQ